MYLYLSRLNRLILLLLGLFPCGAAVFGQTQNQTRPFEPLGLPHWIPWDMDPRKQPGWQRLAQEGAPLGGYRNGQPVWVYRGAGWSRGTVETVWERNGTTKVVVKLADERGGHPYTVCHDSRNICRRND